MQDKRRCAELERILIEPRVIPVLSIARLEDALPLARALAEGGLTTLEITLRTSAALAAIRTISKALPNVSVGVGTVRTPEQAVEAIKAGAEFIVSPGMTPHLSEAAPSWSVPLLPGVATASEAMVLSDLGYSVLKFFPAEPAGGVAALKSLAAPLPDIRFCPTGGIDAGNAATYLALPNVVAVGGSWVAPAAMVERQDWSAISVLARDAHAA
ncbi:MAG: bifunctional 4-hydroxy-2-oxoglutarate aldolase/2-dehydro-3-deoxy-phosphogluconate aldolase [Hyphomicrobiaceae bacterium]